MISLAAMGFYTLSSDATEGQQQREVDGLGNDWCRQIDGHTLLHLAKRYAEWYGRCRVQGLAEEDE